MVIFYFIVPQVKILILYSNYRVNFIIRLRTSRTRIGGGCRKHFAASFTKFVVKRSNNSSSNFSSIKFRWIELSTFDILFEVRFNLICHLTDISIRHWGMCYLNGKLICQRDHCEHVIPVNVQCNCILNI